MPRQQVTVENTSPYDCLNVTSLAMVYAPEQCFENLYDMTSALMAGTIFKSLNKPFSGKRC
ncbi:MAG: spore coat associated protein CotJA [Clostridia bacterium]|nr:spore coat associated protein CotJA [Clostridia bacterium]